LTGVGVAWHVKDPNLAGQTTIMRRFYVCCAAAAISSMPTLLEQIHLDSTSRFGDALESSRLVDPLAGEVPFTVFAPINGSFGTPGALASSATSRVTDSPVLSSGVAI
jgi:uncharacterized surface protein with fasciclin (FAS1) repeats